MMNEQMFKRLKEAVKNHENVALVKITQHPDPALLGTTSLLRSDGTLEESSLPTDVSEVVVEHSLPLLKAGLTKTIVVPYGDSEIEFYVEIFQAPPQLIVAGAGHVSEPVAEIGKMLGFHVTVIDDRQKFANRDRFPTADEVVCTSYVDFFRNVPIHEDTYILLLTRGHQFDVVSLQELLKREEGIPPENRTRYIGMIGSRRRISGVFEQLKGEFTEHNFTNIYSPVGLDIGAQSPTEIAISIFAEILMIKNATSGRPLKEKISSYSKLKFRERVRK